MRILLSYPGHSISTFDVAKGWQDGLRLLGHEVFIMQYEHNVPFYGAVLDYWIEKGPNEDFKPTMFDVFWLASQDLTCKALDLMKVAPLDFVLIVTGLLHHPRVFEHFKTLEIPTVLIFTESPYNDEMLADILPLPDVVFTNDLNSVEPFRKVNPNSFYMPHSYNPSMHHPSNGEELGEEYRHEVFFLGSLYEERKALFEELARCYEGSARLDIVGTSMDKKGRMTGEMINDELIKHYWGSQIVLSPNRTTADYFAKTQIETEAWSMGPRVYEVAACGAFQLTDNSRGELQEVFGDVIPIYRDGAGLAKMVAHFLEEEGEREALALMARKEVAPCTFENRARHILFPTLEEVL